MKIILSSINKNQLKNILKQCENIPDIHKKIMELDYFCFIDIKDKKHLAKVQKELYIYFTNFNSKLYITAMHNSFFYEEEGISKLNYWEYFRNIVQLNLNQEIDFTDTNVNEYCEKIINKIQNNNFNRKPELTQKVDAVYH